MTRDLSPRRNLFQRISVWKCAWGVSWILVFAMLALTTAEISQFLGLEQFQGTSLRFDWDSDSTFHHYRIWLTDRDFTANSEYDRMQVLHSKDTALEIPVLAGHAYQLRVQGVSAAGDTSRISEVSPLYLCVSHNGLDNGSASSFLPQSSALGYNFPNPFNRSTSIPYSVAPGLAGSVPVSMEIYNMSGQVIRQIVNREQLAGQYRAIWDGFNHQGEVVSAGNYICLLQVGEWTDTRLLTFVK